jgi:hypothetical protein
MKQLNLFTDVQSVSNPPEIKTGYKPHRDISVQPNGTVLYRCRLGWGSNKDVAIQFGYIPPKGFEQF